uniref:NADH-ubiquinone oxidoreductase chain 5 n=1 Tax=Phanerotoma flava TaxID=684660 RepID=D8WHA9_9HYME|nr:NADH dehydrogenase subunit 5 [Phanerotoma flava]
MYFLLSLYIMIYCMMMLSMTIFNLLFKMKIIIQMNSLFINSMNIEVLLFMDWISMIFIMVILFITSIVILYSISYMMNEKFIKRFMILIMIFMISMIILILIPNLIYMMIGWDGLGLSSYCLIIYYQNKKSFNSGMITILMNRFGDICFIISITILIYSKNLNIFLFNKKMNIFLSFLIIIATITKSAQIPFSTWLPLAMAAPTPVSSLVHSSTLVTAGLFILMRFMNVINNYMFNFMLMISILTMLMSGLNAMIEFDIKKIIAFSTLSQLGFMLLIFSLKMNKLMFFHLINHAIFKSLLFLCSGIIIHNNLNNQDIRQISFFYTNLPLTNSIFFFSNINTIVGMPFLNGIFSKDLMIEMFNMHNNNIFTFLMLYLSMMLTMIYSFRLINYINILNPKILISLKSNLNFMNYSINPLLIMTIIFGSILNWLIFNSMNFIMLKINLKILIYNLYFISIFIILMIMKIMWMKKNMFYKFILLNYHFLLNFMFNKSKIFLFKNNQFFINNFDHNWLEIIIFKMFIIKMLMNKNYFMKNLFMNLMMMSMFIMMFF